jgi:hypothetical protein
MHKRITTTQLDALAIRLARQPAASTVLSLTDWGQLLLRKGTLHRTLAQVQLMPGTPYI